MHMQMLGLYAIVSYSICLSIGGVRMVMVSVPEAARRLGISTDTLKRRLKRGLLLGEKQTNGHWLIEVPNQTSVQRGQPTKSEARAPSGEIRRLEQTVAILQKELERRSDETERLHVLLQQALDPARAIATPQQMPEQSPARVPWWWRLWRR